MKKQSKTILKGYKRIPKTDLAINKLGTVFNIKSGHTRTPRNIVIPEHGRIVIEKVLLWVFKGETPRKGQIMHIDGQKSNKSLENIKYKTPLEFSRRVELQRTNLTTALRCYFQINKKAKPDTNQPETKVFLWFIAVKRAFFIENHKEPLFDVFFDWLNGKEITTPKVAKMHDITQRTAQRVINRYTNKLTSSVCNELKAGVLTLQPYLPTQSEKRKAKEKLFNEFGITPPKPFKVPTDIKAKFKELGITPPPTHQKENIWLNSALSCLINTPIKQKNQKEHAALFEMIKKRMFDFYICK